MIVPDERHSIDEKRLIAIGFRADGKMIFVGFTIRMRGGTQLIRPFSARYMRQKEFRRYVKSTS
jgi:uncharacterized DUF497 family protein